MKKLFLTTLASLVCLTTGTSADDLTGKTLSTDGNKPQISGSSVLDDVVTPECPQIDANQYNLPWLLNLANENGQTGAINAALGLTQLGFSDTVVAQFLAQFLREYFSCPPTL